MKEFEGVFNAKIITVLHLNDWSKSFNFKEISPENVARINKILLNYFSNR